MGRSSRTTSSARAVPRWPVARRAPRSARRSAGRRDSPSARPRAARIGALVGERMSEAATHDEDLGHFRQIFHTMPYYINGYEWRDYAPGVPLWPGCARAPRGQPVRRGRTAAPGRLGSRRALRLAPGLEPARSRRCATRGNRSTMRAPRAQAGRPRPPSPRADRRGSAARFTQAPGGPRGGHVGCRLPASGCRHARRPASTRRRRSRRADPAAGHRWRHARGRRGGRAHAAALGGRGPDARRPARHAQARGQGLPRLVLRLRAAIRADYLRAHVRGSRGLRRDDRAARHRVRKPLRAPHGADHRPRARRLPARRQGGRHQQARARGRGLRAPLPGAGKDDRADRRLHRRRAAAARRRRGDRGRARMHDHARRAQARRQHDHLARCSAPSARTRARARNSCSSSTSAPAADRGAVTPAMRARIDTARRGSGARTRPTR